MVPQPPDAEGDPSQYEPLIFVSDASAEAERLSAALRSRGYAVCDVPLVQLVGRVAAQPPALIVCDVDASGALDTISRLRDIPGGGRVDVIFLGEPGRTLSEQKDAVFHESSGTFTRPIDTYALLRKVEALVGAPSRHAGEPATAPPAPGSQPNPRAPPRPPSTPYLGRVGPMSAATVDPGAQARLSSRPPSRPPASLPPRVRAPSAPPALPAAIPLGFGADPDLLGPPLQRHIPQSEMSPELERLLARAEQRVTGASVPPPMPSGAPARLSPEDEVEAVLPADVLEALDEPLDSDDDDEDFGSSSAAEPALRTSSLGSRTGTGSSSGATSLGLPAFGAFGTGIGTGTRAQSTNPEPHALTAPPPAAASRSAGAPAPSAPPAVPTAPPAASLPPALAAPHPAPAEPPLPTPLPPNPARSAPPQASVQPSQGPPATPRNKPSPSGFSAAAPASPSTISASAPPRYSPPAEPPRPQFAPLEVPAALGRSDAVRVLARAIRGRYAGALAFEDPSGIRRVVLRDGDFVTAASGVETESLVAFMIQRGDLSPDAGARLGRKLPQFGRHAGAALIAHGHLRQDDLWTALRAHAEWLIGKILSMQSGGVSLEGQVPGRLQDEPAVFGGATGAEVLVEIVRRTIAPEEALARLGGGSAILTAGPGKSLLSECALSDAEIALVEGAGGRNAQELIATLDHADFAAVLYALCELGVLSASDGGARHAAPPRRDTLDDLDEDALRARIQNRKALVDDGDYFAVLGVGRNATSYDIRRAYSELRREFEPGRILTSRTADLRDEIETILEVIEEAYEILRDQPRRERYRRALDARPRA